MLSRVKHTVGVTEGVLVQSRLTDVVSSRPDILIPGRDLQRHLDFDLSWVADRSTCPLNLSLWSQGIDGFMRSRTVHRSPSMSRCTKGCTKRPYMGVVGRASGVVVRRHQTESYS